MPAAAKSPAPVVLICGEDDFAVSQRAREIHAQWTAEIGGTDHEIISGTSANSGDSLRIIGKLREALQTLPFFGTGKVIWLRDCNFLHEDRILATAAVTEALGEIAQELKTFPWKPGPDGVRLLISAGKVDKRKVFYKALGQLGTVELFEAWSVDDKDWAATAEMWVSKRVKAHGKAIADDALAELINRVGPHPRQLDSEIEKASLYSGDRPEISLSDVTTVCSSNKSARAFALGDALGDRDLPTLLRRLDEELWEVKLDPRNRSAIGLLYGLISKVRAMILIKEMLREGLLRNERNYHGFKAQLEGLPADKFPTDKRFNPLAINPYVLFRALPQAARYTSAELVRAIELLLACNQKLVSSGLDDSLILQQTLVEIVRKE